MAETVIMKCVAEGCGLSVVQLDGVLAEVATEGEIACGWCMSELEWQEAN